MKIYNVKLFAGALSTLFLISCGSNWKAEIESNAYWSGAYGGATDNDFTFTSIEGSGDETIDLPDDNRVCCFLNLEGSGYLKLKIVDEGGGPFHIFAEDSREAETNVANGFVEICSEGTIPQGYYYYKVIPKQAPGKYSGAINISNSSFELSQ